MIEFVRYGADARAALRARIDEAQAGDSLAPVTVVVPSNYSGLSTRRELGREKPLVNVRFEGAARLAELLGAPALVAEGRRPLTPWIRIQAVRGALAEAPGVFGAVVAHPSTARVLANTFRELRETPESGLDRLATRSQRASDVVRLYRRFRELTAAFFDDVDLMKSAAETFETSGAETGPLILYLPRRIAPSLAELYRAAAAARGASAVFGIVGDAEVDAAVLEMARVPEPASVPTLPLPPPAIPTPMRIISATDPEEEAREAIRQVMTLTRGGMPLHRIAVAHSARDTYAGLLEDALDSAEVPHNGPASRTLGESWAGKTVLGLLRIAGRARNGQPEFSREAVMDWLTSAPIWFEAREAPSHRWDEISRDAHVVSGAEQWRLRLDTYAAAEAKREETRIQEGAESPGSGNAERARALARFFEQLAAALADAGSASPAAHAAQALRWLKEYLPRKAITSDAEIEARERVESILEEIVASDALELEPLKAAVSREQFAIALEELLRTEARTHRKLTEGAHIGPLQSIGEMAFDACIVLGMVEGALPLRPREDPVITPTECAEAGIELPGDDRTRGRRAFLATLHSAPVTMLSLPRADIRSQRGTQPSRWLLEAASQLEGKPVYASELEQFLVEPPAWFRVVRSFESALRDGAEPASAQEWDLGSLLRHHGKIGLHFLVREPGSSLARGIAARRSRARRGERDQKLDAWNGRVTASIPVPGVDRPVSPTALEAYAKCPFRYFLGNVLHVGEMEKPEEIVTIEPATIGSVVHDILQRFFEATAKRADPAADWTAEERQVLADITAEEFSKTEREGLTGKDLTWRAEQARISRDLQLLLDRELRERREGGYTFKAAEVGFGVDPNERALQPLPAATFELEDGRTIRFRGYVDRVDERPNGQLIVTDYKTGSTSSYEDLKPDNPMLGGRFLQLPIYALAFRDQSNGPVQARYWFISEKAGFESKNLELNDAAYTKFGEIMNTLVDTMQAGYFPANPGDETWYNAASYDNCKYCPYDLLCPSAQRTEMWQTAIKDPGLKAFAELAKASAPGRDSDD
jgi:RecB family exonuclease